MSAIAIVIFSVQFVASVFFVGVIGLRVLWTSCTAKAYSSECSPVVRVSVFVPTPYVFIDS